MFAFLYWRYRDACESRFICVNRRYHWVRFVGWFVGKGFESYTDYDVVGYARRQEVCDAALQDGVVSQAWTEVEPLIENSDIVVFSLPPDTNARLFTEVAYLFKPGQVVTDVSSAKENFVRAVYESIPKGTFFVSVHPMAGSEKGGYEVSHKNLFKGMGWIVLEDKASDVYNEEVAKELADMGRAVGSRIEFVDVYAHDAYLAMVSHMPHLIAAILTQVLVAMSSANYVCAYPQVDSVTVRV